MHYKVIIKEFELEKPIETEYYGQIDRKGIISFFGLNNADVEWYIIEEFSE